MDDAPTLQDFAASEWNHVSAPPDRYDPVLVPAPPLRRLSAALIDWAAILLVGGPVAGVVTFAVVMWFLGSADREFAQWLFLSVWGIVAVAYGYVEAFGRVTSGKKILRLRLVDMGAPPAGRGWRFTLRWALTHLPLLALVVTCVGITSHASTLDLGDSIGKDVLFLPVALLGAASMHAIMSLVCIASPWRMTPWDRVTGVELRHALPLTYREPHRGFEVVPMATAVTAGHSAAAAP
jgi:hypothetical protein